MKFFVDTADTAAIAKLHELGMVDGVTTNPSLIHKSGRDIKEVIKEIAEMVEGPVSAETVRPGAMIPPRYSPWVETTSNVVPVPKSSTTTGAP